MLTFLIIFGMGVLAAVVFVGWVLVSGTRTLWRFVTGQVGTTMEGGTAGGQPRCRNGGCGTINPVQARFCRRCGSPMTVAVSKIAQRTDGVRPVAVAAVR